MEPRTPMCSPVVWQVPETASIRFGLADRHPFDGMVITHWVED